jgi:hypothetical protein
MIDLLRVLRAHAAYGRRILGFIPALITAEMFYKFHSFSLECLAFLATWLIFDLLIEQVMGSVRPGTFIDTPSDASAATKWHTEETRGCEDP